MAGSTIYSGINAKVKAMSGSLLKKEDYEALASCTSVEAVARKLKEYKAYEKSMAEAEKHGLRRGYVEQMLAFSLHEDFDKIISYIGDFKLRGYLSAVFLDNELNLLKLLLNTVYDRRIILYTLPELDKLLGHKIGVDVSMLVESKNVHEFIESLKNTAFYNIFEPLDEEGISFFDMEMGLDLFYYMGLWKAGRKYLNRRNDKAMSVIIGTTIDLTNVSWIFRLKKYYNYEGSKIYSYLIPVHRHISSAYITKMVEAKSEEELWWLIDATPYGFAYKDRNIDNALYRVMARIFKKNQILNPNTLVGTTGYIFFKELEIKNITRLIESVRYGKKPDETMRYII